MSVSATDFTRYSKILFIDSMVVLEGKPLPTQPWAEIDLIGPILILVVPQVNTEIDKRKRDGRLAKKAREFNRLIAPAADSAAPARIADGPPTVDIAIAACDRIDWDALDDLDPDDADARVVAQILHARGVSAGQRLLFSHDTNPIAMAARHGLKSQRLPDHWLLEPEPSPSEKELAKLKGRVRELETTEPNLNAAVSFDFEEGLLLYQVRPLTNSEQRGLVERIIRENPKLRQQHSSMMAGLGYDSGYDDRYNDYCEKTVPRHAAMLHKRLETHYNQIPFTLRLENDGHIQANNLIVAIRAFGGTIYNRFVCFPIFGPGAPKPDNRPFPTINRFSMPEVPGLIGRHDMEFAVGPDQSSTVEVHCADFRHGREWEFEGIACIDPYAASPFKLSIELTASNLRGAITKVFEYKYEIKKADAGDLINLEGRGYQIEIPMMVQFRRALETRNTRWLQFVDENDEENDEIDDDDTA